MDVLVIHEDEHVLVVNKPAGLMVHGDGRSNAQTLTDWLLEQYPEIAEVGEPWQNEEGKTIHRPGIVHRLDAETSGVLVIAKDQETFLALKKQFQDRTIEKAYNAFVYGVVKDDKGMIDEAIGRSKKDFRLWATGQSARGNTRAARTEYTVIARGSDITFVEARPKTGRTHQLRVHFKSLGHPIVCDKRYAPKRDCILGFTRLALHARSLSFMLDGARVSVEAPLPDDFIQAQKQLS